MPAKKGSAKDIKKKLPLSLVIKGTKQLSDAQLKELTRTYLPSAIERLVELCNSSNDNVALGAIKILLAKNMPDLKATDLTSNGDRIEINVVRTPEKSSLVTPSSTE